MSKGVAFDKLELRSLANKRKSRVVAQTIIDAIKSGELSSYQRLPSERTLADQLGVGRGAIREALSALQLSGVIQIRTGEGSFVNPTGFMDNRANRTLNILDQNKSPLELWEARQALELTLTRMASSLARASDIEAVGHELERMRSAAGIGDIEEYLDANNAFHAALVHPVENTILSDFMLDLIEATKQSMTRESVQRYLNGNLNASIQKHVDIYDAFRTRNLGRLETAIIHHFDELIKFYLKD